MKRSPHAVRVGPARRDSDPRYWHKRSQIRYDFAVLLAASALDTVGLVVQSVTAVAAVTLAFIALRLNARPGIRVRFYRVRDHEEPVFEDEILFDAGQPGQLGIYLELRGFFYGKPTATKMKLTVNIEEPFALERLYWNAPGHGLAEQVMEGKGLRSPTRDRARPRKCHFLAARGIWLTPEENGETVKVDLRAPAAPGTEARGWVHARAKEGDCGVHQFKLRC
jgi:hypothetical protein